MPIEGLKGTVHFLIGLAAESANEFFKIESNDRFH